MDNIHSFFSHSSNERKELPSLTDLFCNPKISLLSIPASYYKIIASSEGYEDILSKLREEGIPFERDNGYELLPFNPIEVLPKCIFSCFF